MELTQSLTCALLLIAPMPKSSSSSVVRAVNCIEFEISALILNPSYISRIKIVSLAYLLCLCACPIVVTSCHAHLCNVL